MVFGRPVFHQIFAAFFALGLTSVSARETLNGNLDPFINLPGAYNLTPDDLENLFDLSLIHI